MKSLVFSRFYLIVVLLILGACKGGDETDLIGNWVKKSDFEGVPRNNAVSFVIGNRVFLGTGYDGEDYLNDFWEYIPGELSGGDFWIQRTAFPGKARSGAVAFSINGKGYIGTGFDGDDALKDFWEFDPTQGANGTWTQKADFAGSARRGAVAFSINGKGYLGTGNDDNDLKDFWQYDPQTDTWTQIVSIGGSKRINAYAVVVGEKAYIGGGRSNGTYQEDWWEFNPTNETNPWTKKEDTDETDEDIARESATTFTLDGKAFVCLGSRGAALGDVWQYDPINDSWQEKTTFEGVSRTEAIGFAVNNRVFVTVGRNSLERYDDIWEFRPNEVEDEDD